MTTIAEQVARVSTEQHMRARSNEFVQFARNYLQAKGNLAEAAIYARQNYSADRVQSAFKSAIEVGGTTTSNWASPLATFSNGFAASLSGFGAFDQILSDNAFLRLPMRTRVACITTLLSGTTVNESKPKAISKIQFTAPTLDPVKSSAICVVSEELVTSAAPSAFSLLGDELRRSLAVATDVDFFRRIIADGVDSVSSTGATADAVVNDLTTALVLIDIGANSKVYICAPPKVVRAWALLRGPSGAPVFPDLGILGGTINGAIVAPSDALTDTVVIVDARQIVADSGPVFVDQSSQASLQMDDDPSDGAQKLTSLWQDNLRALRAERWWASQLLRPTAAAVISGVTLGTSTGT
jgi:hypothetical protein